MEIERLQFGDLKLKISPYTWNPAYAELVITKEEAKELELFFREESFEQIARTW